MHILPMDAAHASTVTALMHGALVLAGLLLYFVTTRVRHQRRHPSAAFAWVLMMTLLPYLGVPLFLLFGIKKLTQRRIHDAEPFRTGAVPVTPWGGRLLAGLGLPPPTGNRSVHFHADGMEAQTALVEMIKAAQRRILLSTFLLGSDRFGDHLATALAQRAKDGVEVYVLLDFMARLTCKRSQLKLLHAAGVTVRWATSLPKNPFEAQLNLRYHRKMLVCDGDVLWSGGRNLSGEYFTHDGTRPPWEDLSFDVSGPLAGHAECLFQRDWCAAGGSPLHIGAPSGRQGDILAQLVASGPDYAEDNVYALLLEAAYHARQRIVVVTPYFVPDEALLVAWRIACRRGVLITLLVPERSNHRLADWARGRALRDLSAAGAEIYLFPRMIHAKAIIVDDAIALCGSANLDGRSLFLNFELMVAFYGKPEVDFLARWIFAHTSGSSRFLARRPSWLRDLGEGLVQVIGFQL